jgi:hypothetical protein
MSDELAQSYLEKPYTVFLFKAITSIYEKWVNDDPEGALRELLKLVVATPTDVKKKLWEEKKKIEKDLAQAYKTQGVDFYTGHLVRNRAARRVAHCYIESFFDKVTRLLDEKGWLERGALKPRFDSKTKLSA